MTAARLILASGSAARRQMLLNAGLSFEVVSADIDEDRLRKSLGGTVAHSEIAAVLAEAKGFAVSLLHSSANVIGSDQILSTGEAILSKPGTREGARETLRALRGRTHWLHSGVALVRDGNVVWHLVETAALTMRVLSDDEIERYLDTAVEDILGCVGAYQIEGAGIRLFERVEGDYFTIMGLPLVPLLCELRRLGVAT